MKRHQILGGLILATVLLAPAISQAAAGAPPAQRRVYDRQGKDYHVWDANEDSTYRQYLTDHHYKYRSFSKQSRTRQASYWSYRHQQDHR